LKIVTQPVAATQKWDSDLHGSIRFFKPFFCLIRVHPRKSASKKKSWQKSKKLQI